MDNDVKDKMMTKALAHRPYPLNPRPKTRETLNPRPYALNPE